MCLYSVYNVILEHQTLYGLPHVELYISLITAPSTIERFTNNIDVSEFGPVDRPELLNSLTTASFRRAGILGIFIHTVLTS